MSDRNQSTASMNKDESSDAVIVPEDIASENDNETLQYGDDRIEVSDTHMISSRKFQIKSFEYYLVRADISF